MVSLVFSAASATFCSIESGCGSPPWDPVIGGNAHEVVRGPEHVGAGGRPRSSPRSHAACGHAPARRARVRRKAVPDAWNAAGDCRPGGGSDARAGGGETPRSVHRRHGAAAGRARAGVGHRGAERGGHRRVRRAEENGEGRRRWKMACPAGSHARLRRIPHADCPRLNRQFAIRNPRCPCGRGLDLQRAVEHAVDARQQRERHERRAGCRRPVAAVVPGADDQVRHPPLRRYEPVDRLLVLQRGQVQCRRLLLREEPARGAAGSGRARPDGLGRHPGRVVDAAREAGGRRGAQGDSRRAREGGAGVGSGQGRRELAEAARELEQPAREGPRG